MGRKFIVALIGAIVIAVMAMPTDLAARGRGGWHGHGHHWHGYRGGWRGPGWGYYGYPGYNAYAYYGCYRTVRVSTPLGWVWRRVWVCG